MTVLSKAQHSVNAKDGIWGQIIWSLIHYTTRPCVCQLWKQISGLEMSQPLPELSGLHGQGLWFICLFRLICWMLSRSYRGQDGNLGKYKKACSTLTRSANQAFACGGFIPGGIANTWIVLYVLDSAIWKQI